MKRPPLPVNREVTQMTAKTRKPRVISTDPPTIRTAPLRDNISGFLPGSCCFLLYRKDEGEEQCVSISPILLPSCLYRTLTTRGTLIRGGIHHELVKALPPCRGKSKHASSNYKRKKW